MESYLGGNYLDKYKNNLCQLNRNNIQTWGIN